MTPSITVHRGAAEIGGSCIEIRSSTGERLILDAGRPLDAPRDAKELLPKTLERSGDATVLICHSHQDHWGLINELPSHWEVMTGIASAKLIMITARVARQQIGRTLSTWSSRDSFVRGPFRIMPILTDHSAFDSYMLLIEVDGKRILYSGDFRNHGRKGVLVNRLIASPPRNIDALIIEGTNLGTDKPTMSESALEDQFVDLAHRTSGRLFVTWSGQNIDRTVTLYRAALKAQRPLVIDLYTADILDALRGHLTAPYLGIENLKVVITGDLAKLYKRAGREDWVKQIAKIGIGASSLEGLRCIAMVRKGSLQRAYTWKGVTPSPDDSFSFSMWSGYLPDQGELVEWFRSGGSRVEHIHTSGHASASVLRAFAASVGATAIIPVHGVNWSREQMGFERLVRVADGEAFFPR